MKKMTFIAESRLEGHPKDNPYWVEMGDGYWFRPVLLNTIENYYTAYYYADRNSITSRHYHTGATEITVLQGTLVFIEEDIRTVIEAGDFVYVPPGTTHYAETIVNKEPMICFGTTRGAIFLLEPPVNTDPVIDVFDIIELTRSHYDLLNLKIDFIL